MSGWGGGGGGGIKKKRHGRGGGGGGGGGADQKNIARPHGGDQVNFVVIQLKSSDSSDA